MLNQPILETVTQETSTYERRTEWSSHGYAYVTMHNTETGHGWGGRLSRSEWNRYKGDQSRAKARPPLQECVASLPD